MIKTELQYLETRREVVRLEQACLELEKCSTPNDREEAYRLLELIDLKSRLIPLQSDLCKFDATYHEYRQGKWMPLYSGKRFWPEDPMPQDVDIIDIAHSLARINRFNGHTIESYSVAQHCVLGSYEIKPSLALHFLLHDAAECYLGDVITPVKRLLRHLYEPLESGVMWAILTRYGLPMTPEDIAAVKVVDVRMLATEARDLTTAGFVTEKLDELPFPEEIDCCWTAEEAESIFLLRFQELTSVK